MTVKKYSLKPTKSTTTIKKCGTAYKVALNVGGKTVKRIVTIPASER